MIAPAVSSPSQEKLLSTVSASRLKCWLQCRLKFGFRYVQQLQKPSTPALFLGSAVHTVLQSWNRTRWQGLPVDQAGLEKLYHEQFQVEGSPQIGEELKSTTLRTLRTYWEQCPIPPNEKPQGVEVYLESDLSSHGLPVLVGVLDLVRPGGRIVDFKTTSQTPRKDQALHQHELQLTCYSVLYQEATGEREGGFELHHLVKLKQPRVVIQSLPPSGSLQKKKLFHLLESYVEGVQREDYIPSPGLHCSQCEYCRECRNWS